MNFLKLQYNKCFFCMKNYNSLDLTDMNSNAVLINDESVEFRDLVLDVCSVALTLDKSNYSCSECNNNLILFHMFKRDVKRYNNFHEYINKLMILQKAEHFLDTCENPSNLIIEEDPTKFVITTEEVAKDDTQQEIQIIEFDPNEEFLESISQDDSMDVPEEVPKRFSTNEDLSEEQRQWIHEEVRHSEVTKGKKITYKCSLCGTTLSTSASLVRHLRDLHILSIDKKQNVLKAELQRSKINVLNEEGPGAYWQCHHCKDEKIYHSEQGFRMHLKSTHPDEELSAQNYQSIWMCTVDPCKESFHSIDDLQNHLKSSHCDDKVFKQEENEAMSPPKRRKLHTLHDLSDSQLEWIKSQASSAEVMRGRKRFFKCSVCHVELSTQASLVRHLRDVHVLKNSDDEKSTLKDESTASKMAVGDEIIWKCLNCDKIYKSEPAFKLHYRMTHVNQTEVPSSLIATCKSSIVDKNQVKDVWKCPACEKSFKQREGLRNHIKSDHPNVDEIKKKIGSRSYEKRARKSTPKNEKFCNECGLKFLINKHHVKPKVHQECHEAFKVLASHMHRHKCDDCRMIFVNEESLQLHLNVHEDPEKVQPILINEKGLAVYGAEIFKEASGDADDVCLEEALFEAWKCGHCSCKYIDENDCVSHQLLLHSTKIFCFVDNREFDGSSGLSKYVTHMKNKHPEYFPNLTYPCGSCGQEFPSIYEKLAHQKLCTAKKFTCDYCDKKYSNKHQLQAHMLFELGISGFNCEQCGKRCKTMSDLRIHYNSHTNARPYQCSLCEKSFKTPAARSTHMEKHTLDAGITCEICHIKLANRSLYQRHKRFLHNSRFREEQYEKNVCTFCNRSFLRTAHFKAHVRQCERSLICLV